MSEQILVQGKLLGIEDYLPARTSTPGAAGNDERLFAARCQWITALCEVLPRALLAELGLAPILLGSSGGGQFLLVLPGDVLPQTEEFFRTAAAQVSSMSGGLLRLTWAATENLGDWLDIRKRHAEQLRQARMQPPRAAQMQPASEDAETLAGADAWLASEFGAKLREATMLGWSPDAPAKPLCDAGKHQWPVSSRLSLEGLLLARHAAPSENQRGPATLRTLGHRSEGKRLWGVLRGDVDSFGVRLRRLKSIEEHLQVSMLYKHFFAGELEVLSSMPDFWRKTSILYSGGDDFAICGAWDALIPMAREIQRLFHSFAEDNLKEFPGPEGKTITMAIAIARGPDDSLARVYEEAGESLELAKCADKDCIRLFGRTLEWKQLGDAAEIQATVSRMVQEGRVPKQMVAGLSNMYRKISESADSRGRLEKVWRFDWHFQRVTGALRDRDSQKLWTHLAGEIAARRGKQKVKLRPAGWIALEWTRLLAEV